MKPQDREGWPLTDSPAQEGDAEEAQGETPPEEGAPPEDDVPLQPEDDVPVQEGDAPPPDDAPPQKGVAPEDSREEVGAAGGGEEARDEAMFEEVQGLLEIKDTHRCWVLP